MSEINFDFPVWLLLLCLLGGVIYAAALYFKNNSFAEKGRELKALLAFLRFSLISILLALLLNPFLKSLISEVKDPIIAIVHDNSQSIAAWLGDDKAAHENSIQQLRTNLGEDFEIGYYALGSDITAVQGSDTLTYADELTNLENIKNLIDQYEGSNLAGVILASDGIFNQGRNPIYNSIPKHIPIFGLALGDTSKRKDALIKSVYHNNIAYLNDITNIQIDIKADNCQGSRAKLIIEEEIGGQFQKVKEQDVSINSADFFKTIDLQFNLNRSGIAHYRARLRGVAGEDIYANNIKDIFIEVLDARQRIRILANAPHPDLAALNTLLSDNKNYEVEIEYMADSPNPNKRSDLVILHNLPSGKYDIQSFAQQIDRNRTPVIYIVGSSTELSRFNQVQDLLSINGKVGSINEVQSALQPGFSLFSLSDELKNRISSFPPLLAPFGEYKLSPSATVLMNQKIGTIDTDYPLIAYQNKGGKRKAVICAEGIWKWKVFDYLERQNFDIVKELVAKTVTYTSIKEDKRKFRVSTQEKLYNENEDILFTAELYNENYELVNDEDVFLSITSEGDGDFNHTFTKKNNYYSLNIGTLAPGKYSYTATTNYNGEKLEDKGRISIQQIQYELYNLEANHGLLYALAEQHNGSVYYPSQISQIATDMKSKEGMKPILYQYAQNQSIIDFKWLFYLLAVMLAVEWFLRRYNGHL